MLVVICQKFPSLLRLNNIPCTYHIRLSTHQSVHTWVTPPFTTVNKAAIDMNVDVPVFLWDSASSSYPGLELLDYMVVLFLTF